MKEKYVLNKLGHARSPQIKELQKISEESGVGIYKIHTEWPGHPEMNDYLRVGYNPDTKEISFIDFDGGPWISFKFKFDDGCVVTGFNHDGKFNNITVIIEDPNYKK